MNQTATSPLPEVKIAPWMRGILMLGGMYNLYWGFFIYNFPESYYGWLGAPGNAPLQVLKVQAIGVLLVAGVILVAAFGRGKRKWFMATALLAKTLGPLWIWYLVAQQTFTRKLLFSIIMNDVVWALVFVAITIRFFKVHAYEKSLPPETDDE